MHCYKSSNVLSLTVSLSRYNSTAARLRLFVTVIRAQCLGLEFDDRIESAIGLDLIESLANLRQT